MFRVRLGWWQEMMSPSAPQILLSLNNSTTLNPHKPLYLWNPSLHF